MIKWRCAMLTLSVVDAPCKSSVILKGIGISFLISWLMKQALSEKAIRGNFLGDVAHVKSFATVFAHFFTSHVSRPGAKLPWKVYRNLRRT